MLGETIGHYQVLEKLGAGGMGVVYKARDVRLERDVAIKVIRPESCNAALEAAFLREARMASSLNHSGIVTVYDILTHGDVECIVMEFVAGMPLNRLIPEGGFAVDRALELARLIGDALGAAHAAGVVHRDLKPANILVRADGAIKILDFGLAKLAEQAAGDTETHTMSIFGGHVVGTVAYMAPEQARGEAVDRRADIFSFGMILSQMLTGTLPFHAPNPVALLHAMQTREPEPVRKVNPEIPAEIEAAVLRALAKEPRERFQTIGEMLRELSGGKPGTAGTVYAAQEARLGTITSVPGAHSQGSSATVEKTSIAVLPFRSLSPDPEDRYLAAGIASELTSALTGVPGLRIAPQMAAFRLPEDAGPTQAARALNTRYVVTGAVRRAGERVRVSVELVDGVTETVAWSRRYDRLMTDIFAVQEDIAKAIVGSLGGQLIRVKTDFAYHTPTDSLDAWGLVRKAYHIWNYEFSAKGAAASLELLRRAIELDPEYALARAWLGMYLATIVVNFISRDRAGDLAEAAACAERACQLAPEDPEVLENSAIVWLHTGQYEKAVQCLKRAVQTAPFDLVAWGYLGLVHGAAGDSKAAAEAHTILERLIAEAPDHPSIAFWQEFTAIACLRLGAYEAAAEHARKATEMQPGFVFNQALLAEALCRLGREEEARQVVATIPKCNPYFTFEAYEEAYVRACRSAAIAEQFCGKVKGLF